MSEIIVAVSTAITTFVVTDLIKKIMSRNKKISETPFSLNYCKDCFFFKEFKRNSKHIKDSDTTIIKLHREQNGKN